MIFNSLTFIIFLFIALVSYYSLVSARLKIVSLIVYSVIFYGFWSIPYYSLLCISAIVDFGAAKLINSSNKKMCRKGLLATSIIVNLSLLGYFKYYNFFVSEINVIFNLHISYLDILLPVGISFYTFQSMSYTIDVYRKRYKPEANFLYFLNYITFFPQLVAGPIVRFDYFKTQIKCIREQLKIDYSVGVRLIIYGLFLKVCVADNLAPMIDEGFGVSPEFFGTLDVLTLAYAFGFQIYFDFCGYSMIAIGSAMLFGIQLPKNFEFPYLSSSIREFWSRWHISLSSWIRDYLYEPIKTALPQSYVYSSVALVTSWSIMGLWHGASWTFVVWGAWNGSAILLGRVVYYLLPKARSRVLDKCLRYIGWVLTLNTIMLGWIWFRVDSTYTGIELFESLVFNHGLFFVLNPNLYIACALILLFIISSSFLWKILFHEDNLPLSLLTALLDTLLVICIFAFLTQNVQFIYFQF